MAIIDRLLAPGSGFQKNFFFLAKRFVAGESIDTAIQAVRELNAEGMTATLDFLGEDVLERDAAIKTRDAYLAMLDRIRETGVQTNVSVKMTAMGLLIDPDFALDNLTRILQHAERNADPFVRIDMEGTPGHPSNPRSLRTGLRRRQKCRHRAPSLSQTHPRRR